MSHDSEMEQNLREALDEVTAAHEKTNEARNQLAQAQDHIRQLSAELESHRSGGQVQHHVGNAPVTILLPSGAYAAIGQYSNRQAVPVQAQVPSQVGGQYTHHGSQSGSQQQYPTRGRSTTSHPMPSGSSLPDVPAIDHGSDVVATTTRHHDDRGRHRHRRRRRSLSITVWNSTP